MCSLTIECVLLLHTHSPRQKVDMGTTKMKINSQMSLEQLKSIKSFTLEQDGSVINLEVCMYTYVWYVCMYVCMYVCIYICICMYEVCMYTYVWYGMYVCIYIHMYMYLCISLSNPSLASRMVSAVAFSTSRYVWMCVCVCVCVCVGIGRSNPALSSRMARIVPFLPSRCVCVYIHTCMHTCMHTYIHTNARACT